jgi:hypothetical protein
MAAPAKCNTPRTVAGEDSCHRIPMTGHASHDSADSETQREIAVTSFRGANRVD